MSWSRRRHDLSTRRPNARVALGSSISCTSATVYDALVTLLRALDGPQPVRRGLHHTLRRTRLLSVTCRRGRFAERRRLGPEPYDTPAARAPPRLVSRAPARASPGPCPTPCAGGGLLAPDRELSFHPGPGCACRAPPPCLGPSHTTLLFLELSLSQPIYPRTLVTSQTPTTVL